MAAEALSWLANFSGLSDPRVERGREHPLLSIVGIALCAILGGADDWVAVERFGNAKLDWFKRFLELPNGIPSHDTFGRLFARLDPDQFEACFREWVAAVEDKSNEITAIPKLLRMLDLEGALVSIDAMGCQKEIAAQIRQQEADYLLAVKE